MCALGDSLASSDYDVICLQECWVQDDFQYIQNKVRSLLPYSHYYHAGFLGSGLAIFCKWPILSTSMFPFVLNGRPAAVWRGDWYAGKGVAMALLRHESGTLIEVFNTHVLPLLRHATNFSFMLNMVRERIRIIVIDLHRPGILQNICEEE